MKKLYLQTLLLATLAAQPLLASAEEWRLGPGGWNGREIYLRRPGEREWHRIPGSARALGDGWVIGTDQVYGGYGIYRWNGHGWDRAPGAAVEIGGSYLNPWVVNDRGERFNWNGYDWRPEVYYGGRERHERHERSYERNHDDRRDHDHGRDDKKTTYWDRR